MIEHLIPCLINPLLDCPEDCPIQSDAKDDIINQFGSIGPLSDRSTIKLRTYLCNEDPKALAGFITEKVCKFTDNGKIGSCFNYRELSETNSQL